MILTDVLLPATDKIRAMMPYIIPMCSPDKASICDAPLERKAVMVSREIPLRSPVIRAFMISTVSLLLNGMVSM